jgi:hypothetical protein
MSPIAHLMYNLNVKPIREYWSSAHELLMILADLSIGQHLVIRYTPDEELAVARLYAAIHLALCGPLPLLQHTVIHGVTIIGCDACAKTARENVPRNLQEIIYEIAYAARDGKLGPPAFAR